MAGAFPSHIRVRRRGDAPAVQEIGWDFSRQGAGGFAGGQTTKAVREEEAERKAKEVRGEEAEMLVLAIGGFVTPLAHEEYQAQGGPTQEAAWAEQAASALEYAKRLREENNAHQANYESPNTAEYVGMLQKLEEFGKRRRGGAEEASSEQSRMIGRAIAKVRSSPGGKKWISTRKVTGLLSSMHAAQSGIDEATGARAKKDERIRLVNNSLEADRENRKKWAEPSISKELGAWGKSVARCLMRVGQEIDGLEEVVEKLKKSNDGLVRAYQTLNLTHNRLLDAVAEGSLELTRQATCARAED